MSFREIFFRFIIGVACLIDRIHNIYVTRKLDFERIIYE